MRLIDADELYKKFIDGESDTEQERSANQLARYLIRHEPTVDTVPVVRCRECKKSSYGKLYMRRWCNRTLSCTRVKNDDFCSYGERH